jgi:thioredoxin reductase (NADPH)
LGPIEALDILNEWKSENRDDLSLIISDYLMPEMLGSDFLIEANKIFPKAKKIMLTGQADSENVLKVLHHMSLFRFMGKPWDPSMMNDAVLEAIKEFDYYYQLERKSASRSN